MDSFITLDSPLDYQVIQRRSREDGMIPVAGSCSMACDRVVVKLSGTASDGMPLASRWLPTTLDPATGAFHTEVATPAGGWYRMQIRAMAGPATVASKSVAHVGVGEVFVGAGQSNSTSCGGLGSTSRLDGRTHSLTRRVATFDGRQWRIADDPQPGAHDSHTRGSFWPAFGDAMASHYQVPIGVAVTGHAGTSVRQWTRQDSLFQWTLTRLRQLGRHGFRALLWHQGENDADTGMDTRSYATCLAEVLGGLRAELGRDFPCFVAKASFIPWPKDSVSAEIRAAQQSLWQHHIALEGPDTDAMRGPLRDCNGTGIHFSKLGLKAHGEAWAAKVAAWLDPQVQP